MAPHSYGRERDAPRQLFEVVRREAREPGLFARKLRTTKIISRDGPPPRRDDESQIPLHWNPREGPRGVREVLHDRPRDEGAQPKPERRGKGAVVELISEEGGDTLELNRYEKGSPFDTKYEVGEGLDHLAFVVKDLDTALAEAKMAGHPVVQEMREPGSRYAYIQDPNGIWIELCQFG